MTLSADPLLELTRPLGAKFDFRGSTGFPLRATDYLREPGDLQYGTHEGSRELRERLARSYGIPDECILLTPGATFALFLVALAFVGPGERALLARPCYPPARATLRMIGATVAEVRTSFDKFYSLGAGSVGEQLSGEVKLVSLASPQNPSGRHVGFEDLRGVSAILQSRAPGAPLLIDETFRQAAATPRDSALGIGGNVIVLGSLSKAHGAAGLRIGWIASSNSEWISRLTRAKANILHSNSVLDEAAAAAILDDAAAILDRQRAHLAERLRLVSDWIAARTDRIVWCPPDAGAICCVRPATRDAATRARFDKQLEARGVGLPRGSLFGDEPGTYRLGFGAQPVGMLRSGLEALGECLAAAGCGA